MADFFVFLNSFITTFTRPFVDMLLDNRIATFLGAPLLFILFGFWLVKMLYSMFLSHRDSFSASNYAQIARNHRSAESGSGGYSSAYRSK